MNGNIMINKIGGDGNMAPFRLVILAVKQWKTKNKVGFQRLASGQLGIMP